MTEALTNTVLEVRDLVKTFHTGFFRKRVEAVRGISFHVEQGEIIGLLGPNGAGKTSAIKTILHLLKPTSGDIQIFGYPPGHVRAASRIGYMPENPYIYPYLRPLEFLDFAGALAGMSANERRHKAQSLVERLGLAHATHQRIGEFSKGMMQRIGLAQVIIHNPDLLILDEPMSGLDPIGRKEIRDLLLEQRNRGKTLMFTSHILNDIEHSCDRVVIMNDGKISVQGSVHSLLKPKSRPIEVILADVSEKLELMLQKHANRIQKKRNQWVINLEETSQISNLLNMANSEKAHILSVTQKPKTLEKLFLKNTTKQSI